MAGVVLPCGSFPGQEAGSTPGGVVKCGGGPKPLQECPPGMHFTAGGTGGARGTCVPGGGGAPGGGGGGGTGGPSPTGGGGGPTTAPGGGGGGPAAPTVPPVPGAPPDPGQRPPINFPPLPGGQPPTDGPGGGSPRPGGNSPLSMMGLDDAGGGDQMLSAPTSLRQGIGSRIPPKLSMVLAGLKKVY